MAQSQVIARLDDNDRRIQQPKCGHVGDDLMAPVHAIGYATETGYLMHPEPAALPLTGLPEDVHASFKQPVVPVHPRAGNVTRQLLIEGVSVGEGKQTLDKKAIVSSKPARKMKLNRPQRATEPL